MPARPQKQFRMIEAWATQNDLDVHGGAKPPFLVPLSHETQPFAKTGSGHRTEK
jgi:hypothetical protein